MFIKYEWIGRPFFYKFLHLIKGKLYKLLKTTQKNPIYFWNFISFFLVALSGILLNLFITNFYGAEGLGYFNQVYALYLIFSQVSIIGVHLSIIHILPKYEKKYDTINRVCSSGLLLTFISSFLLILLILLFKGGVVSLLRNQEIATGLLIILPALLFASINKFFLAILNGIKELVSYALLQGARALLIILLLLLLIYNKTNVVFIPSIFSFAELILLIIIILYFIKKRKIDFLKYSRYWFFYHLTYGIKAFFGNFLQEINSRINIIILGMFAEDKIVGLFSFASFMTDGFIQLTTVFRTIINPDLTKLFIRNKTDLEAYINRNKRKYYQVFLILGVLLIILFPIFNILIKGDISGSWLIFTILMVGIIFSSGYLPFQMILNQTGYPSEYSIYLMIFFILNVILNLLLTPILSMYGTAIGTSLSFIIQIFLLRQIVLKKLKIKI